MHTFFTDETTVRCVKAVKDAARAAGRDPAAVRVWSCFATIGDHLPEAVRLKKTVGRMATYLQAYGDLMVRTNQWDPAVLKRFRADKLVATFPGAIDQIATTVQLEQIAEIDGIAIPNHPYHFRMAGAATTNLFVTGIGGITTRVAHGRGHDSGEAPESLLGPPEAATGE